MPVVLVFDTGSDTLTPVAALSSTLSPRSGRQVTRFRAHSLQKTHCLHLVARQHVTVVSFVAGSVDPICNRPCHTGEQTPPLVKRLQPRYYRCSTSRVCQSTIATATTTATNIGAEVLTRGLAQLFSCTHLHYQSVTLVRTLTSLPRASPKEAPTSHKMVLMASKPL